MAPALTQAAHLAERLGMIGRVSSPSPDELVRLASQGSESLPLLAPTTTNVTKYVDGFEANEQAMIDVIRGADHVVNIGMFAWSGTGIGRRMADEVVRALHRGREVNIVLDQVGSFGLPFSKRRKVFKMMRKAGANIHVSRRWSLRDLVRPVDHRKLVEADGRSAVVSSLNTTSLVQGWRESGIRVDGPAAAQAAAQAVARIVDEGGTITARQAHAIRTGAAATGQGRAAVAMLTNTPGHELHATRHMMHMMRNAKERSWSQTPFITDPGVTEALTSRPHTFDRRILLAKPDAWLGARLLNLLNMSFYRTLTRDGVRIWELDRMSHAKVNLFDDLVGVGTLNLGRRSTKWNHEQLVVTDDPKTVSAVEASMRADVKSARREITREIAESSRGMMLTDRVRRLFNIQY